MQSLSNRIVNYAYSQYYRMTNAHIKHSVQVFGALKFIDREIQNDMTRYQFFITLTLPMRYINVPGFKSFMYRHQDEFRDVLALIEWERLNQSKLISKEPYNGDDPIDKNAMVFAHAKRLIKNACDSTPTRFASDADQFCKFIEEQLAASKARSNVDSVSGMK